MQDDALRGVERRESLLTLTRIGAIAAAWGVLSYLLVDWVRPDTGLVSVSFAVVQPAAICAFIACMADPRSTRRLGFYMLVPVISAVGMVAIAVAVLAEGAICIAMYAPLWIMFGMAGTALAYRLRPRAIAPEDYGATFNAWGLLALPLVVMPVEASLPVPVDRYTVSNEIIIDAPAAAIWPLMRGMGQVGADEGRWTLSQSLLGLPRPKSAFLVEEGLGATRLARWQRGVAFREVVTEWQPDRRIGWRFDFAGSTGWDITDPHLRPDGPYLRIERGGYTLTPLPDGRQLLRLATRYTAQTHFNRYAAQWGKLFLGDVQDNVLAIIRDRAETAARSRHLRASGI